MEVRVQKDFVELAIVVGHQSVGVMDEDFLLDGIDLFYGSDVAIEDFDFAVVPSLNDVVANLEPPS